VVVVRCETGHGTGFIVDPDGWIVTNHHVIDDAKIDPATGLQSAVVHVGALGANGYMTLLETGLTANVYKSDRSTDLALLKISEMPDGMKKLPAIGLAESAPQPGSRCVVIGHPAAGMLWTVRSGEVCCTGIWPVDTIDSVMRRLSMNGGGSEACLGNEPRRRVLISSCGLNPGDSGSPLVNADGEVIGVSFAIPGRDHSRGIQLDKFAYHVHLEEVRAFLADRPKSPIIHVPELWPADTCTRTKDLDGDGVQDAVVFTEGKHGPPVGFALDLDGDSRPKSGGLFSAGSSRRNWDFEFAVHYSPVRRTFYDADNDGNIDLILCDADGDGKVDGEFRLTEDGWIRSDPSRRDLECPKRLIGKELQQRLAKLLSLHTAEPSTKPSLFGSGPARREQSNRAGQPKSDERKRR